MTKNRQTQLRTYVLSVLVISACAVLALPEPARAQGSRKDDIVFNAQGRPMAGATVRICTAAATAEPCTPLANIYSDVALTQALANPLTTDGLGNYSFYAAPGRYMVEIDGPGITTKQLPNVILPNDPSVPTFTSLTTTSGISAFSLSLSGNLTVTGSTAVTGTLTVGGAPVPSTREANTWSAAQTFSQDLIMGSQSPWTDVRAAGAICNGTTDSTTGIANTLSGLAAAGGTAFLPNNCLWTPGNPLPTSGVAMNIALGGALKLGGTLHVDSGYVLGCHDPFALAAWGQQQFRPGCQILGSNPAISVDFTNDSPSLLKDLVMNTGATTGITVNDGVVNSTFDNVCVQVGNSMTSTPIHVNGGFGNNFIGGCFNGGSAYGSTLPGMWFTSPPSGNAVRLFSMDHTNVQGPIYFDSPSGCGESQMGIIRSEMQLSENLAAGEGMFQVNAPYNLCQMVGIEIDNPTVSDNAGGNTILQVTNPSSILRQIRISATQSGLP